MQFYGIHRTDSINVHSCDSYALFDKDGHQVPLQMVSEVGKKFEFLLEEVYWKLNLVI